MYKVTAIIPTEPSFSVEQIMRGVESGLDTAAGWVQSDFEQTTQSWDTKPEFSITTPKAFVRDIGTDNIIYGYVNQGTPPHTFGPRTKRALRFTRPFAPKTQKNVIGAFGGNRGDEVIYAKMVNNPGILPREFDETIQREWIQANRLQQLIQEQIDNTIK